MTRPKRILVIEDDPRFRDLLKRNLVREGYQVDEAGSFKEALAQFEQNYYHLATIDIRLVDTDANNSEGMTLLDELRTRGLAPAVERVVISAHGTKSQMRDAFKDYEVADYVIKDTFDLDKFLRSIDKIFRERVRTNADLDIILEGGLTYEELVNGLTVRDRRIKKDSPLFERAAAEAEELLTRLFWNARSIVVERVGSQSAVHSGTHVVKVLPFYAERHGEPTIVKIGDYRAVDRENANFQAYVQGFIGGSRSTNVLGTRRTPWLGGIIYSLVGAGLEHVDSFRSFYRSHPAAGVGAVLDNLFEKTCGIWYADRGVVQHCRLTREYQERLGFDDAKLDIALRDNFPSFQNQNFIYLDKLVGRRWVNPVIAVRGKELTRQTYQCITHGDLNGDNIIVDRDGNTWLIDFGATGKGHILRDLAELESVVKFELLETPDLEARIELEDALSTVSHFADLERVTYAPADSTAAKAFETVMHLRRIARTLVHPSEDFGEYSIALLYTALNLLRFYGLPKPNRLHALVSAGILCEKLGLAI